jgi:hypothetical protein
MSTPLLPTLLAVQHDRWRSYFQRRDTLSLLPSNVGRAIETSCYEAGRINLLGYKEPIAEIG